MLALGLLSVVQIVFLPGYLVLRALRMETGLLRTLVFSFALSLVVNHFLVVGLVLAGAYRPVSLYAIFAIEAGLFLWGSRSWLGVTIGQALEAGRARLLPRAPTMPPGNRDAGSVLRFLVAGAACALMAGFAALAICRAGDIFREWDAVLSWNRWAAEWAGNRIPRDTMEYPQLLPCNLSVTYVFIQDTSIWFFAKGFQFLFCLLLLVGMYDLARRTGSFGYVAGILITYALLVAILRFRNLSSGYADVPVAMFAFVSVYALLLARDAADQQTRFKYLLLGAVCAAGAALTKQAGLFAAAVYPVLGWLLAPTRRGTVPFSLRENRDSPHALRENRDSPHAIETVPTFLVTLLFMVVLLIVLVAPWYVFKQITIRRSADVSMVPFLLHDIHAGRTAVQRLAFAAEQLLQALTIPGAAALLLAIGFSLRDPVARWLVALVVVPFSLLWAVGFSYDLRNVALAIPLAGAAAGVGAAHLADVLGRFGKRGTGSVAQVGLAVGETSPPRCLSPFFRGGFSRLRQLRVGYGMVLLAVLLAAGGAGVSRDSLLARQIALQREGGMADLNRQLYDYQDRHGIRGQIVTDYLYMQWLPGMEQYPVLCTGADLATFRTVYEQPGVKYAVLFKNKISPQVHAYLGEGSGPGSSRLLAESDYYLFFGKREDG